MKGKAVKHIHLSESQNIWAMLSVDASQKETVWLNLQDVQSDFFLVLTKDVAKAIIEHLSNVLEGDA